MQRYKRWAIFTAGIFLLISATLVNTPHIYYMAAVLLMLPPVSYVIGMLGLRDLDFTRTAPASGFEGESAVLVASARSTARLPRMFLQVSEEMPGPLQPERAETAFFNVPAGGEAEVAYEVDLVRRGVYALSSFTVTALDPLGIYAFSKRVSAPAELTVYPVPQAIPDLIRSGAERFGYRDIPVAAARGSGVDPDGVREYVPGDPLRRMHWKSTARTGRLSVIEFEESRAVNVALAIDLREGSDVGEGNQTTLEYLVTAAASLAQMTVRQGASVRLVGGPGDPTAASVPGHGTEQLFAVLDALARAQATEKTPLSERLFEMVGILQPGTTLVILTADLDERLPEAVAAYTSAGIQVLVVYADPRSFRTELRHPLRETQYDWYHGLGGVSAQVVLLHHNPERRLRPEVVTDAGRHSEQSVV
jgi:uncharacterized protein (DUF58 family)